MNFYKWKFKTLVKYYQWKRNTYLTCRNWLFHHVPFYKRWFLWRKRRKIMRVFRKAKPGQKFYIHYTEKGRFD